MKVSPSREVFSYLLSLNKERIRRVRTKPELLQVLDDPGCGGAPSDAHRNFNEGGPVRRGGSSESG